MMMVLCSGHYVQTATSYSNPSHTLSSARVEHKKVLTYLHGCFRNKTLCHLNLHKIRSVELQFPIPLKSPQTEISQMTSKNILIKCYQQRGCIFNFCIYPSNFRLDHKDMNEP